jgi:hypothetical protein
MKLPIAACGALIALTAFATSADARMMGGGSTMSASRFSSNTSIHTSVSSTLGDSGHKHWKKPIDSDGGGQSDPPPKKTTSTGTGGGTKVTQNPYGGYYGGYGHHPHPHYGGYYGNGSGSSSGSSSGCGSTPC